MKETNRYLTRADESKTEDAQLVGAATVKRKNQALLQIVPVAVHGPHGRKNVNALLDMGSQLSLIKHDTASQLGIDGPVKPMKINTINGSQTRSSRQVNFEIQSLLSEDRFQVTAARTTPMLNVSGQAIDWPNEKLKWSHLADLNLQRTSSDEIEVLLGMDSFSLIVPREVREGHPGSPAAVYTRLGWVASGRLPGGDEQDEIASQVNLVQETDDERQEVEMNESFETMQDELFRSNDDEQALKVIEGSMAPANDRRDMRLAWKRPDIEVPDIGLAACCSDSSQVREARLDRGRQLAQGARARATTNGAFHRHPNGGLHRRRNHAVLDTMTEPRDTEAAEFSKLRCLTSNRNDWNERLQRPAAGDCWRPARTWVQWNSSETTDNTGTRAARATLLRKRRHR